MTEEYQYEEAVQTIAKALRAAIRAGAEPSILLIEAVSLSTSSLDPAEAREGPVDAGIEMATVGLTRVARAGGDVADAVANALARAASAAGGSEDLLSGRLGSWEAALVRQILAGAVGPDDEMLGEYGEEKDW